MTSALPPSAGKIIPCRTVWLLLNERMWVTMSLSPGATTAWCGGRSWIWNNETVNGLHHCYWFFLSLAQCFMSTIIYKYFVASRKGKQALKGAVLVDKRLEKRGLQTLKLAPSLLATIINVKVKAPLVVTSQRVWNLTKPRRDQWAVVVQC